MTLPFSFSRRLYIRLWRAMHPGAGVGESTKAEQGSIIRIL